MASIICLANHKGGVGKTSLTIHLAGAAAQSGASVLVIDLDPQGHLSDFYHKDIFSLKYTIRDLLLDKASFEDVVVKTKFSKTSILPANILLSDIDDQFVNDQDALYILRDIISEAPVQYDYIFIDTSPYLSKLTKISMTAATHYIIPVEAQKWAIGGAAQMISFVDSIRRKSNPSLKLLGIVLNKIMSMRRIESDMKKIIRSKYGDLVFNTELKNKTVYSEAISKRKILAKGSKLPEAKVIQELFKEIEARV